MAKSIRAQNNAAGSNRPASPPAEALAVPTPLLPNRRLKGYTGSAGSQGESSYVTHAELLRLAERNHCLGIETEPVIALCRPGKNFWVFKATVYKSARCRGFVGYGEAHPGNVSPLIFNHAELRMAETRAVNRALRKAYGIGLCSVEELPPWRLTSIQVDSLRRTLKVGRTYEKGAGPANEGQRSWPVDKAKSSRGGLLSRPGRSVRSGRARR